ncbi:MAG: ParA family protein, partial [Peptostreptococcaceae bacterium]|nr:ParA family protein [Peptostreptococcaceae bacterium]
PVDINIKKSQFQGVPVCNFDKNSRASVAYNELSQEIIEKIKEE